MNEALSNVEMQEKQNLAISWAFLQGVNEVARVAHRRRGHARIKIRNDKNPSMAYAFYGRHSNKWYVGWYIDVNLRCGRSQGMSHGDEEERLKTSCWKPMPLIPYHRGHSLMSWLPNQTCRADPTRWEKLCFSKLNWNEFWGWFKLKLRANKKQIHLLQW